jgi:hypothetical protein
MNNIDSFKPTNMPYEVVVETQTYDQRMEFRFVSRNSGNQDLQIATNTLGKIADIFSDLNKKFVHGQ